MVHTHHSGKSFVQTQKKVWTSQWSVILRTFYRQILSLLYSSFSFETSATGSPGNYNQSREQITFCMDDLKLVQ